MGKALISKHKWSQNDFRLLVVLLLTVIYPIFVSVFFAIFLFVLMPVFSLAQPHVYWLVAALIWVLLCTVILPCFRDKEDPNQTVGLDYQGEPAYTTKAQTVQPFSVQVEESNENQRDSLLTNKSKTSYGSTEKVKVEDDERVSLDKSKENLRSSESVEKEKITQSGEFLNDILGSDRLKEEEAECEVHAEQEDKEGKQENKDDDKNSDVKQEKDEEKDTKQEKDEDKDTKQEKDEEKDSDENDTKQEPKDDENNEKPFKVREGKILESVIPEDEEMTELGNDDAPAKMRRALPNIDTSRASGSYECSMPTPTSDRSSKQETNMVFLFVNPDMAAGADDIIVNQQGEVKEQVNGEMKEEENKK